MLNVQNFFFLNCICYVLKQLDFTHGHFVGSLDVEHQVLNKGDLIQV